MGRVQVMSGTTETLLEDFGILQFKAPPRVPAFRRLKAKISMESNTIDSIFMALRIIVSDPISTYLFAVVVLHALLLIMPGSAWAAAEENQEIGETYNNQMYLTEGRVDSAVLAPTGDRLYTLKNGVLSQYNLSPLTRISTVKVAFDSRQTKEDPYKTFITSDEKRIIIYSNKQLRQLDVASGKLIKTVPFESDAGMLNENELFTVDNQNKAVVWNALDLTIKMKFEAKGEERWVPFEGHIINHSLFLRAGNRILLFRPHRRYAAAIFVFDASTYKFLWRVKNNVILKPLLSADMRVLYVNCGADGYSKLWRDGHHTDLHNELKQKYKDTELRPDYCQFDLSSGQFDLPSTDFKETNYRVTNTNTNRNRHFNLNYMPRQTQISPTSQYQFLSGVGNSGNVTGFIYIESDKPKTIKSFIQYTNGEAALFASTSEFIATRNARASMKMKNKAGEIVPINEATFEKFNKSNLNHKEW